MTEEKQKLLKYDEIKTILESDGEHKIAKIIANKLNKKIFMRKVDEVLYVRDDYRNYYRQEKNVQEIARKILFEVTFLLEQSKDALKSKQKDDLKLMFKKEYKNFSKNVTINKLMPQIREYITMDDDSECIRNLDDTKNEIHFYNGYIDMKTKEFKKRDINVKPVTFVIQRNKNPSTTKQRTFIYEKVFKPILPKEDDLKIILLILGSAMTGNSSIDQSSLFWLGQGSNGKSFIMELFGLAFGDYVYELMNSTFENGNKDSSKVLNSFLIYKYIRLAWVNEFSARPIDESLFKDFVDGVIKTTSLYKDGQNKINHLAKVVSTMNELPKFIFGGKGMTRRMDGYTGVSTFVDNIDEVDESKHIYAKDKTLKSTIIENGLLDAFVDIIVEYASRWINGVKIKPYENENMCKSLEIIKDGNDKMKDFTDKYLIKTTDGNDRINKNTMYELYKKQNPRSLITLVQLIDSLKKSDAQIEYNKDLRNKDNTRGAFFGVKFRTQYNDDDETESDLTIEQQIMSLENEIYGKQQLLIKLKQQLPVTKKDFDINEDVIIEHDFYDYDDDDDHYDITITKNDFDFLKYNYFINKSKKLIKVDSDDEDDDEIKEYLKEVMHDEKLFFLKKDFRVPKTKYKLNRYDLNMLEEKPKKSKKITQVEKSKKIYVDPVNKKIYEYDENDELECDIKSF